MRLLARREDRGLGHCAVDAISMFAVCVYCGIIEVFLSLRHRNCRK